MIVATSIFTLFVAVPFAFALAPLRAFKREEAAQAEA
jgi:hypothetical protein